MTCSGCSRTIDRKFRSMEGIISKDISHRTATGSFEYDPEKISKDEIIKAINDFGHYSVVEEINSGDGSNAYDLIIVGGGSAAFSAASKAESLGLSILMVNAGLDFGGTCVNVGCVPSKHLIRAAETAFHAGHSNFAGIRPKGAEINFSRLIKDKKKLVAGLQQKKYMDVVSDFQQLKLLQGRAEFVDEKTIVVDGKEKHTALKFLIAIGATTNIPDIKGLNEVDYLTNVSLFNLEKQPRSLIVLGGGYIALEIAQAYHRLGTRVTLLQRSVQVLSKQTADLAAELTTHLKNEGLNIHTGLKFIGVSQQSGAIRIIAEQNGRRQTFEAEKLLVSTGIKPNTDKLGAERIGLKLTGSGHVKVDEHLQSNLPHIFAAGDCIGTPSYVYTAAREGNVAIENAFSATDATIDYSSLPWVVFTDPQVAGAGLDEDEAASQNIPVEVSKVDLKDVPRAIAANDTRGFIKLIRNPETDHLIGARVVAPEGGELIRQLSMAIQHRIPVQALAEDFYPYLTLGEGIKLAAISFGKDLEKLSCCAV